LVIQVAKAEAEGAAFISALLAEGGSVLGAQGMEGYGSSHGADILYKHAYCGAVIKGYKPGIRIVCVDDCREEFLRWRKGFFDCEGS
jgi:hypothetical protein